MSAWGQPQTGGHDFSAGGGGWDQQQFGGHDAQAGGGTTFMNFSYGGGQETVSIPFDASPSVDIPHSDMSAPLSADDDDDRPILEELGIHPEYIKEKAFGAINPFKLRNPDVSVKWVEDEDLAGPLVFAVLFNFALMLGGKVHVGHVYAYGMMATLLIYALLNLMCNQKVGFFLTASILGYNILPLVFLALLTGVGWLILSSPAYVVMPTCAVFISWSAWCSTQMFVCALGMHEQKWLVFYPLLLFYTMFALIAIF
eukprot:TRINITY_DN4054_c0_g2_i1.p1 TRINITY_DN4054_c0_g2~~TRINITY_DN4054_c0_g2_i1.p1  ORF type:complete len:256 (+),score=46.05 TRINITY_DN4054_c0_g2_i1:101-868(+)